MPRLILFNKPYGVLSQFTPEAGRPSLKAFISDPTVYPAGRLDADSEGLLALTDDGGLQHKLADPAHKLPKTYLVQVEGVPGDDALQRLAAGIPLDGELTRPAQARRVDEPAWLWPRTPPVRFRRLIPTSWLELVLAEGRNRQVRRMTAAVGFPTLRLVRYAIGEWTLEGLAPGESRALEIAGARSPRAAEFVAGKRQPFTAHRVRDRAVPHTFKRKK